MKPQILVAGAWRDADAVGSFRAVDPSCGQAIGDEFPVSSRADLEAALSAACDVAADLAATPPETIAAYLDAYADGIQAHSQELATLAHQETGLPAPTRLAATEIPRTFNQLRLAAQAVRARSWSQPIIDTQAGLRSALGPMQKPVLIFGPNNFPLAYNAVAGSDFASAIAARNPVIAKAHPNQPGTTRLLAQIAHRAVLESGLPAATVQMVYHCTSEDGLSLCADPRLGAIGFTGSRAAGLALMAVSEPAGVPFFGELSAINPVLILPGALAERGPALAQEYFASCSLGSGQFCTNPGLVIVPEGEDGDAFVTAAARLFAEASPALLLSQGVMESLQRNVAALREAGAQLLGGTAQCSGPGFRFAPSLLGIDAARFLAAPETFQTEAFGPVGLIVRSPDEATTVKIIATLEGSLTGSVYSAEADRDLAQRLAVVLRPHVGRLLSNRMPTGVAVSAAMNHGGPFPSTTQRSFTAVGMPSAIARFAALQCWDHTPDHWLPVELQDSNPLSVWRVVDGVPTQGPLTPA